MIKHKIIGLMAADPNGVVGLNGRLPWDYPEDLGFFRARTKGQIVIAGRVTVEGLPPQFFDTKDSICVTRNSGFRIEFNRVSYALTPSDAITNAKILAEERDQKIFMIGGAVLANAFLSAHLVDEFILTRIKAEHTGDCRLDLSLLKDWREEEILKKTPDFDIVRLIRPAESKPLDFAS